MDWLFRLTEPGLIKKQLEARLREQRQQFSRRKLSRPRAGAPLGGRMALVGSACYCPTGYPLTWYHPFINDRPLRTLLHVLTRLGLKTDDVYVPGLIEVGDLARIHAEAHLESLWFPERMARQLEAPALKTLSPRRYSALIQASLSACAGTLLAAREALQFGAAINFGGGFHHAKPRYAEGFCLLADIPVAAARLISEEQIQRVLLVDLDVHQGNGSILCLEEYPDCYCYSIHQEEIYPSPKEWGDWDFGLPAGTGDTAYLEKLQSTLPQVLESVKPDLVFIVAGCDTLEGDPLASLNMTPQGLIRRDAFVTSLCRERGTPFVITLAGGYRDDAWRIQGDSLVQVIEATAQLI